MHIDVMQVGSHIGKGSGDDPIYKSINLKSKVMLIEPVPFLFKKLKENYNKDFPNNDFIFLNKAVSNKTGTINFYTPSPRNNFRRLRGWADQIASTNKGHLQKHIPNLLIDEIEVESVTLNSLIESYGIKNIKTLHIDAEGHDYSILMDLDFKKNKPNRVIFEHTHIEETCPPPCRRPRKGERYTRLTSRFLRNGYELEWSDRYNTSMTLK
tara:strand:+ start:1384 stop:2016 length:633 start_codon:yes stop_codon:yes gene_type:complete